MSAVTKAEERPARVAPVAPVDGPLFRRVVAERGVDGHRRKKLLALVAAFSDAGCDSPPVEELALRVGVKPSRCHALLLRLAEDGWLTIEKRLGRRARVQGRSLRFTVTLDGEGA